ncbi:MAG: transposase, partial [Rhodospirillales bacterium]|nr:transposase [Rhodospirillales bacterium]
VLGVPCTEKVWSWDKAEVIAGTAEEVAGSLPAARYVRLFAGQGSKGPRLYDWAYVELADLSPQDFGWNEDGRVWTRGLLIRRRLADGEPAFFSTWCPQETPLAVLVAVEGRRWAIEDAFETAKTELGLDHNETRSWQGWHRHVSLIMLAFALLMVIRHKAEALAAPEKGGALNPSYGPMVSPGNPPSHLALGSTSDRTGPGHRLVRLETMPSGHSAKSPSQTGDAAVIRAERHWPCVPCSSVRRPRWH